VKYVGFPGHVDNQEVANINDNKGISIQQGES